MTAPRRRPRFDVFAVEDTTAQICWSGLPQGRASLWTPAARVDVEVAASGSGAAVLAGLAPGRRYELVAEFGGVRTPAATFRTLDAPPGRELFRFATISDLHIGERTFGLLPSFTESMRIPASEAYPARCARAAVAEAAAWGASRIVVKGDLTWSARQFQWELVAEVLSSSPLPIDAVLGNHDVGVRGIDGRGILAARGIDIASEPVAIDHHGLRIVLGHSAVRGASQGAIGRRQREQIADLVRGAPGPAFLVLHHYVEPLPFRSRVPAGISRSDGDALLAAVAEANPATLVTFGHTHRHRRGLRHGLVTTETGSTKDHPGVWAGYVVHEGGIRQVVRRISEPSCMAWTDRAASSVLGLWGPWSRGRMGWRCFSHRWPEWGR